MESLRWRERRGDSGSDEDWFPPPPDHEHIEKSSDATDYYSILGLERDQIERLDELSSLTQADNLVKVAYRKSLANSERKQSSLGGGNGEDDQTNICSKKNRDEILIARAFHQLATFNKRRDFKEKKKLPSAHFAKSPFPRVETQELEMAFARLILQNYGQVAAGSSCYKDFMKRQGYQEQMKSLGNPKKFCLERTSLGFRFIPGKTSLGDLFAFTLPPNVCHEWLNGYCSKSGQCTKSHSPPCGCFIKGESRPIPVQQDSKFSQQMTQSRNRKPTIRCKFYPNCDKGARCSFLHSDQPEPCQWFPDCKYGTKCRFYHPPFPPSSPSSSSFPPFDWSQCSGQMRFLVVGDTKGGKLSVLNCLHNYLSNNRSLEETEIALPSHQSNRKGYLEYRYGHPDQDDTSITFIDATKSVDFRETQEVS
jgi:hypothetical protein